MGHYVMNKMLLFLMSVSLLAFGIHFYEKIHTTLIVSIMAIGYVGLGIIVWLNEKKYKHLKQKSKKVKQDKIDYSQNKN